MSQLSVGFDKEALSYLEAGRDRLIAESASYVARCGIGLMIYCIPRVQNSAKMCLVDRDSGLAGDTIKFMPGFPSLDDNLFSGVVSEDKSAALHFMLDEEVSRQVRDCAALLQLTVMDFIKESCRLYLYLIPCLLDENMAFGFLQGEDFKSVQLPGLTTQEGTTLH